MPGENESGPDLRWLFYRYSILSIEAQGCVPVNFYLVMSTQANGRFSREQWLG